jgi:hypothetical protein
LAAASARAVDSGSVGTRRVAAVKAVGMVRLPHRDTGVAHCQEWGWCGCRTGTQGSHTVRGGDGVAAAQGHRGRTLSGVGMVWLPHRDTGVAHCQTRGDHAGAARRGSRRGRGRKKPRVGFFGGRGTGDRKRRLNEAHRPHVRGVRVHGSTGYNAGEGEVAKRRRELISHPESLLRSEVVRTGAA